jgi:hypothetical protein
VKNSTIQALIATLFLSGCAGPVINYSSLSDTAYSPREATYPIKVFLTAEPQCRYDTIGIVRTSTGAFDGGMDTFVDAMKDKAREVGGDAILLKMVESKKTGYVAVAPGVIAAADGDAQTSIIIRFLEQSCMQ